MNDPHTGPQLAVRVHTFIKKYCTHVGGSRTGEPLFLAPWQQELVSALFGEVGCDGSRKYQIAWLEAPRKTGKTTLAAALMLYMLLVDEEPGAEIAVCSSTTASASFCFNMARQMVESNADMSSVCSVRSKSISYKNNNARLASASSLRGADLSMAIIDDVQYVTQMDLHETLTLCMTARRNPIILYLASAGSRCALGWDLHRHACSIRKGQTRDPSWLVRIYGAEREDDWTDPSVWKKAHPGLGVTIGESFFRDECIRAMAVPGNVDAFRRSFLNVWTQQSSHWLDMAKWDGCRQAIDWERYAGKPCKVGLDLSATTDLTAIVAVFAETDGGYTLLPFAFCPDEAVGRRSMRDGVDYREWINAGFLTATAGSSIDYAAVLEKVLSLCSEYDVTEVLYDKWCASMLVGGLIGRGIACTPVKQDAASLNPAVRELERAVEEGRLRHDGNPVLRWCTSNTRVEANAAGDIKPTKRRSRDRIDLTAASLFAIAGHLAERTRA
jgi:phage terminase large subunit-like protein